MDASDRRGAAGLRDRGGARSVARTHQSSREVYPIMTATHSASTTVGTKAHQLDKSKISSSALGVLFGIWSLLTQAYAQGDTGPPGMQALGDAVLMLSIFPFIGVGLAFLFFKATGKAWMFFLAPFFFMGLVYIDPLGTPGTSSDSPGFFSAIGAWLYWTHIVAIAVAYRIFTLSKKTWVFFLAPIIGWIMQFICLVFIIP